MSEEIGFVEDFALSSDREEALKQLVPGSEDYFYYHCLHYQNSEQFDKAEKLFAEWNRRYGRTARLQMIMNRQALLTYGEDKQKTLDYLTRALNLQFNHQREISGREKALPSEVDQKLISREKLTKDAFAGRNDTGLFEDSALRWLVDEKLSEPQRKHLLQRLSLPDNEGILDLIVKELSEKNSSGFGSMTIHRHLLPQQLDELLKLKPELLNQSNFVNIYLSKLAPNPDVDWQASFETRDEQLRSVWEFVEQLGPAHNSLKASVLFHRLQLDLERGKWNRELFMEYIALPRHVGYINPKFMEGDLQRRYPADLNADFRQIIVLPPIINDQPLVREYLLHFFEKANDWDAFAPYIENNWLKRIFAESKIVNGLGDAEKWYSLLTPAEFQELKERVDLDFLPTNPKRFGPNEPVAIEMHVKHVETLIVKVFEINTQNWYRQKLREIDTDINLDGLVPNVETVHEYDDPPVRRIKRRFEFPELAEPGIYVIDFIGNGKSSRTLVRKGRLNYVVQTVSQGQLFTILDQDDNQVQDASIWLEGREFTSSDKDMGAGDKAEAKGERKADGRILVPFSANPGRRPIVISADGLSSLEHFQHEGEQYQLQAGIHVDRETLIQSGKSKVIVRAGLTLNGEPISLSQLEEVRMQIRSVDFDGVQASQNATDFKLFTDRESTHEFRIPPRLLSIHFEITAKVSSKTRVGEKVDLRVNRSFTVNQIDKTLHVGDLHLVNAGDAWFIEARGRTGELLADRPATVYLKHHDFKNPVNVTLKTDKDGRIDLGSLNGIDNVRVTGLTGIDRNWNLTESRYTYYRTIDGIAGQSIEIPYLGDENEPLRSEFSLLEIRGGTYYADRFDALSIAGGMLKINKLPRGDYELFLHGQTRRISLKIADGEKVAGYVIGEHRRLEIRRGEPLQIVELAEAGDKIRIKLNRTDKFTRVHLIATRFEPRFDAFDSLSTVGDAEPDRYSMSDPLSLYVVGRAIGDEYQYILNRKYAKKFPGNMLDRPELLLNPWEVRTTSTDQQHAAEGSVFSRSGSNSASDLERGKRKQSGADVSADFANLDFIPEGSVLILNASTDKNGVLEIDKELVTGRHVINVVATDPLVTVSKRMTFPLQDKPTVDLRLTDGLDPEKHFTQQKTVSILKTGETLTVEDIRSSRIESYDNLRDVYRLFQTTNPNEHLSTFSFVLDWPAFEKEKKQELYSEYACHELNFFILKKDPEFFAAVVRPYLENKMDKTFLDHWLLEENLQQYLDPWEYARLNVVERVLLGLRTDAGMVNTRRHLQNLYEVNPTTRAQSYNWFELSVTSGALEGQDRFEISNETKGRRNILLAEEQRAAGKSDKAPGGFGGGGRGESAEAMRDEMSAAPAPPKDAAKKSRKSDGKAKDADMMEKMMEQEEMMLDLAEDRPAGEMEFFDNDIDGLADDLKRLYQKLDQTREWAENNYYKLLIQQQIASLVDANQFWKDYANHDPESLFFSQYFPEASGNFTEMMFALSVLDLPMERADQTSEIKEGQLKLTATSPMVVFHEEIRSAVDDRGDTSILVSQNFYRQDDRYVFDGEDRLDKFVRDEFLTNVAYGCQVVVTNPTSSPQKVDVLLQIPVGAFPINSTKYTRSVSVDLQPYRTEAVDYFFYFPVAGEFAHYPVQVAKEDRVLAFAERSGFHVVNEPSEIDRTSWAHISQNGTDDQVLTFLAEKNPLRLNLEKIAFRMQDEKFFKRTIAALRQQYVYHNTLWSYSIKHDAPEFIAEYLANRDDFLQNCGLYLDSELITIDPVVRRWYEHLEYDPLVNARAHQLGRQREILNDRFAGQYNRLMNVLSQQRQLDSDSLMAVTYYMLLQDRIEESLGFFGRVTPDELPTRLQYDYFTAYMDMFNEQPQQAGVIADKYAGYPVDRWRKRFAAVSAQIAEIKGGDSQIVDEHDRNQQQAKLANSAPGFDFKVEDKQVTVTFQNMEKLTVSYYEMDVELLFSTNPFVQQQSGQLAFVKPKTVQQIELPKGETKHQWVLPEELHKSNVLVEISGDGLTKSQAYFAHAMNVQVVESFGQLQVTHSDTDKRMSKVYVKVYAVSNDGQVKFYKDGYTDLRGRFDYASLSTNELDNVRRFSLLVMSEENGALVREALPPKQ